MADEVHVGLRALAHGCPAELHGGKTFRTNALGEFAGGLGRRAEQRAGVAADLFLETAAEEFPDGQAERLALDVPEREVNAAHRVQADAASARVDGAVIHQVPEPLGLERVLADEQMLQASADGMAERPFDDGLRGERRGVHLADAGDAGVGGDFNDERILPAVALRADDFLRDVDGFDVGDFHVMARGVRDRGWTRRREDGIHKESRNAGGNLGPELPGYGSGWGLPQRSGGQGGIRTPDQMRVKHLR